MDTKQTMNATEASSKQHSKNTWQVDIPYPAADELHLKVSAGACRLNIHGGEEDAWVTGSYYDPTGLIHLHIIEEGSTVSIKLGQSVLDAFGLVAGIPELHLWLGNRRPFTLAVEAGAGGNYFELGGVPLQCLTITHGAGTTELDFVAPNPERMSVLELGVGAGALGARNLANANFAEMSVAGGIDSCKLDFRGIRKQDSYVRVSAAISSVEVMIPSTLAARITSTNLLGAPDADAGFVEQEHAYWTKAALQSRTPLLQIDDATALGRLRLRSVERVEAARSAQALSISTGSVAPQPGPVQGS